MNFNMYNSIKRDSAVGLSYISSLLVSYCDDNISQERNPIISNWSETRKFIPSTLYEPKNVDELLSLYRGSDKKLRPIGSALSPNGVSMSKNGSSAVALSNLDTIMVEPDKLRATVGAGIKVCEVLKELQKYDLTLQNFSAIQDQQMGGWTAVAAHGTGCKLPTVEEQIISFDLVTPGKGLLKNITNDSNPQLFQMAKVGLGSLGVVSQMTVGCIPRFNLSEVTFSSSRKDIEHGHKDRLSNFRHVRYMWYPYSHSMVAVVCHPSTSKPSELNIVHNTEIHKLALELLPNLEKSHITSLGIPSVRDILLDINPLDLELVKRVNQAEAESWAPVPTHRVADSAAVLGYDCGGQQLVMEVCFSCGRGYDCDAKDLEFVRRLLSEVERLGLPAPGPVEQRWSTSSRAPMSPAYSEHEDEVFTWVGIIMYLPHGQSPAQRQAIIDQFSAYKRALYPLIAEYKAVIHWGKIDLPDGGTEGLRDEDAIKEVSFLQKTVRDRFPVQEFNRYRKELDPNNVLSNDLIDTLFSE